VRGRVATQVALAAVVLALASGLPHVGASAGTTPPAGEQARSTRDGVFSPEQAGRGDRIFQERCVSCHQPAEFTTPAFMAAWSGQTAESLFDAIRTTMPTDNPGSLRRQEYADLLAYLFKLNGLPAGEAELKATPAELRQVVIEAPVKPAASRAGTSGRRTSRQE
jgi:cytochrome c5